MIGTEIVGIAKGSLDVIGKVTSMLQRKRHDEPQETQQHISHEAISAIVVVAGLAMVLMFVLSSDAIEQMAKAARPA